MVQLCVFMFISLDQRHSPTAVGQGGLYFYWSYLQKHGLCVLPTWMLKVWVLRASCFGGRFLTSDRSQVADGRNAQTAQRQKALLRFNGLNATGNRARDHKKD